MCQQQGQRTRRRILLRPLIVQSRGRRSASLSPEEGSAVMRVINLMGMDVQL